MPLRMGEEVDQLAERFLVGAVGCYGFDFFIQAWLFQTTVIRRTLLATNRHDLSILLFERCPRGPSLRALDGTSLHKNLTASGSHDSSFMH